MDIPATAELPPPGPATRADAEVRAVLSALRGLSSPADEEVAPPAPSPSDRYTRVRLHARGGLGQVWLGRDELVRRAVAIKEPRDDRPGEAARAALEREAWVLGQLQHPNIVPLYDLVRCPDGRAAFYVMPFLGGDGLHDLAARFHRSRPPGPASRLTLLPLLTAFLDVCAALDHAHGRGVWHLDIKGANVKLGPAGAAVVLDWGLARLAVPTAGDPPAGAGSAGGTPAFMAPEQAESPSSRLGPHTDVYGLGALLYLLLTGQPPHPDAAGHPRATLAAALRRPLTPPRTVWSGLPAALEAICLKALAVEPADRYGSVAELRAEVQHWLADEPVAAFREPLPARLARWGRRHKRVAAAAAAVLVTAVLALAVGVVAVDRERRATAAALVRERDSFRQALKAGDDYFTAVTESPLLQGPGQQPVRRELLRYGLAYYQDFLKRRGDEPALRAEVAAAWDRVGKIQSLIGTLPEGLAAYRQALALGEQLLAANPADADLRARLARWDIHAGFAVGRAGRFADALGHLDRAVARAGGLPDGHAERLWLMAAALATRGGVLDMAGDPGGAWAATEQAEAVYVRLAPDPVIRRERGLNLVRLGQLGCGLHRLAEAAGAVRQARELFAGMQGEPGLAPVARWGMADCDHSLGMIATAAGDPAGALAHFEAARAARRRLVDENPSLHAHRGELLSTCLHLTRHHWDCGDPRRAAEVVREACAEADELVRSNPTDFHFRALSTRSYRLAAGDAEARGDLPAAAQFRARSTELFAGFAAERGSSSWPRLAQDAVSDGLRQVRWGQWRAALESFREAAVCLQLAGDQAQARDHRASAARQ